MRGSRSLFSPVAAALAFMGAVACGAAGRSGPETSSAASSTTLEVPASVTSSSLAAAVQLSSTTTRGRGVRATTTTTKRDEGVTAGVWVVGLDGSGLHRLGDLGGSSAVWSPDGRSIAVSSADGLNVVSAEDGTVERTIHSPSGWGSCLDWSAQGRLAWVSGDGALWMADREGEPQMVHSGPHGDCRWSPDGSRLAVGGQQVRLYSPEGAMVSTIAVEPDIRSIGKLAWAPDGSALAGVEDVSRVEAPSFPHRLWIKPSTAEPYWWPTPTGGEIYRLAWASDRPGLYARVGGPPGGNWVASTGIRLFDVQTGTNSMVAPRCCILAFQALSDGGFLGITETPESRFSHDTIAVFSRDGSVRHVVARAHRTIPEDTFCPGTHFSDLRPAPNGDRVLIIGATRQSTWRCDYVPPS